jgi:hypothetical protein
VFELERVPVNMEFICNHIDPQLTLHYSTIGGAGPWIEIPITNPTLSPAFSVPAGSTIWFETNASSNNFSFDRYDVYENGRLICPIPMSA